MRPNKKTKKTKRNWNYFSPLRNWPTGSWMMWTEVPCGANYIWIPQFKEKHKKIQKEEVDNFIY